MFALLFGSLATAAPKPPPVSDLAKLEKSVVRLANTSQRSDWRVPWNPGRTSRASGSGFVIEGGRILTNAHVVADSKNLVLYLHGDANPYDAKIIAIGHDCDLALVEPVDKSILKDLVPLAFGDMPKMGEEVQTLGYPAGGRWLSNTRGIVSRIDVTASVHSGGSSHLSIQTDAAINPGNSGGPVLKGGKVAGVAFQGIGSLENTGFFIPPSVVQHFLDDVAEGDGYEGFPKLDVNLSNLDSPAARRRAGMNDGETGVRIDFVHPKSPALGVLKAGDILLTLGGEIVGNDGTFAFEDQRLQMPAILDRFDVGDTIVARVLRKGERLDLNVPLATSVYPDRAYETLPTYYVYAGLVFVPLNREYVETMGTSTDNDILYEYAVRQLESPDAPLPGRVVLFRRLDHQVNATLGVAAHIIIDTINGVEVHTLADVAKAIEGNQAEHHVIEFAYLDRVGVLDRKEADAAHPLILEQYAVPKDRRL